MVHRADGLPLIFAGLTTRCFAEVHVATEPGTADEAADSPSGYTGPIYHQAVVSVHSVGHMADADGALHVRTEPEADKTDMSRLRS